MTLSPSSFNLLFFFAMPPHQNLLLGPANRPPDFVTHNLIFIFWCHALLGDVHRLHCIFVPLAPLERLSSPFPHLPAFTASFNVFFFAMASNQNPLHEAY